VPKVTKLSRIALGEERGYQARGGAGTVDFHERPAGLEDQADYICGELIPAALARIDGLGLGDVAVLYCGMGEDILSEALRLGSDTERETTDLAVLADTLDSLPTEDRLGTVIDTYPSRAHVDNPERGCPVASAGAESRGWLDGSSASSPA
jgi:hypothetical protein